MLYWACVYYPSSAAGYRDRAEGRGFDASGILPRWHTAEWLGVKWLEAPMVLALMVRRTY